MNNENTSPAGGKLKDLKGKRVLLISLIGYSKGLISGLKELGADVDYFSDKPDETPVTKLFGRLQLGFYQNILHSYYVSCLEPLKDRDYDFILVIRGEYTPRKSVEYMRSLFPRAKTVLYMWDGLEVASNRGVREKWSAFDRVYTFDRIDYEANRDEISFLPLFYYSSYLPENIKSANSPDLSYDISFIGTGHDDRVRIIKTLFAAAQAKGLRCYSYFFLPYKLIYLKNKLFNREFTDVNADDIHYSKIPFEKLYAIYADSRCIADVENRGQHGLTMRSIEILGLRRKFITTNKDIVNYDFYNPSNILVIDRDNPQPDMEWFNKPYEPLSEEIYQKYSIGNWFLEVFK